MSGALKVVAALALILALTVFWYLRPQEGAASSGSAPTMEPP